MVRRDRQQISRGNTVASPLLNPAIGPSASRIGDSVHAATMHPHEQRAFQHAVGTRCGGSSGDGPSAPHKLRLFPDPPRTDCCGHCVMTPLDTLFGLCSTSAKRGRASKASLSSTRRRSILLGNWFCGCRLAGESTPDERSASECVHQSCTQWHPALCREAVSSFGTEGRSWSRLGGFAPFPWITVKCRIIWP
jgi:hypothetical protein